MNQILYTLTISILLSLYSTTSLSTETPAEVKKQQVNNFVKPKIISRTPPNYPQKELDDGNVGVVEATFMVDKTGKTFEPIISYSSKPSFEPFALLSIRSYRYKPATLNGNPVDSISSVRVVFLVDKQDDQVSSQFNKHYKSAYKELEKETPNKSKIEKKIASMENSNNMSAYSYRHLNSIKYTYATQFADEQAQIDAIYELLLFESRTKNASAALGKELRLKMRRRLVTLLVKTGQYGTASIEYNALKRIDPNAKSMFKTAFKQIQDIRKSDQLISRKVQLSTQGFKSTHLLKRSFGLLNAKNVSELKLRCEGKFHAIKYQAESEYKIPDSWGSCALQIIGDPNSTIELYQI